MEMVLDTKDKPAVMDKKTYEDDIVGGSMDNLNSLHKHMKMNFHKHEEKEKDMDSNDGVVAPKLGSGMAGASMMVGRPARRIHKYV
jgi:hypothetical protein